MYILVSGATKTVRAMLCKHPNLGVLLTPNDGNAPPEPEGRALVDALCRRERTARESVARLAREHAQAAEALAKARAVLACKEVYEREARAVLAEEKGRLAELESLLAQIGLPTSASATASCDSPTQPLR